MEGEQIVAINPDTLSDKNYFSYRDLQQLCIKLNLGGNGKRSDLEYRLKEWNRWRYEDGKAIGIENDSTSKVVAMNVIGNNFSLMEVCVKSTQSENVVRRKKRKSIVGMVSCNKREGIISPTLLRALRPEPGTPGKGILKQWRSPSNCENIPPSVSKLDKITFSPFNGVKFIPNRYPTEEDEQYELDIYPEYDDNSSEDQYYDASPEAL